VAVQSRFCYLPFWFMVLLGFDSVKDQIGTRAELRLLIPLCILAPGQGFASRRTRILLKPGSCAGFCHFSFMDPSYSQRRSHPTPAHGSSKVVSTLSALQHLMNTSRA